MRSLRCWMLALIVLSSARLGTLILDDWGGLGVGDSVHVVGTSEWCLRNCLESLRCVHVLGIGRCDPTPVAPSSWGRVKALFRRARDSRAARPRPDPLAFAREILRRDIEKYTERQGNGGWRSPQPGTS